MSGHEQLATLCSEWPNWLFEAVDKAMKVSDEKDWSTEQVVGYAILTASSQAYSRGLEDAASIADKHAVHRRTNASDFKDIDQPHTASEAWEYAVDEALEIATAIRALGSK